MSEQTNKPEKNATKEYAESGEINKLTDKLLEESLVTVEKPNSDHEEGSQKLGKKQSTQLMEHEQMPQTNLQVNQSFQKSEDERRSISR